MKITASQLKRMIRESIQEAGLGASPKQHVLEMLKQVSEQIQSLPDDQSFMEQLQGVSFVENENGNLILMLGRTR